MTPKSCSSSMHARAQPFIPSPLPSLPLHSQESATTLALLPRTTARLTLTILSHALYAKQILSQPVSLLRREKERANARARVRDAAGESEGVARRSQSSSSRMGASAATRKLEVKKEKFLEALDRLCGAVEDAVHEALFPLSHQDSAPASTSTSTSMGAELDLLLLFGPTMSIPKEMFLVKILLPCSCSQRSEEQTSDCTRSDATTTTSSDSTSISTSDFTSSSVSSSEVPRSAQEQKQGQQQLQIEKQIAVLERKLTRFLMMKDAPEEVAAQGKNKDDDEEREERLNITSTSHSSSSAASNSKCHVLLRAPERLVERLLSVKAKKGAWLLKRGFDAKGLRVLLGEEEGTASPGNALNAQRERGSGEATSGGVLIFGGQEDAKEKPARSSSVQSTTEGEIARRTFSASSTASTSTSSSSSSLGMSRLSLASAPSQDLRSGSVPKLAEEENTLAHSQTSFAQDRREPPTASSKTLQRASTSLGAELERKPFSLLARNRLNSNNSNNSNGARRAHSSSSSFTEAPAGIRGANDDEGMPSLRRAQTDAGERRVIQSSAQRSTGKGSGPVMGRMILDLRGKSGGAGGAKDSGEKEEREEKLWCLFDTPVLTGKL